VARIYNVISPHLDDAALSCSLFLAANPHSQITTIFAGGPPSVRPLTPWDRAAGYFVEGGDVIGVRRGEDISAAAVVNASTLHLTYWDRQYRNERYNYRGFTDDELPSVIASDLVSRVDQISADAWVIPLGISHPDHRIAADAGLIFAARHSGDIYLYEELPYAVEYHADAADRKRSLAQRGFVLEEDSMLEFLHDGALKAAAIRCHSSQRRSLRRRAKVAARTPERIWRLIRP
jgi:LmbE family N-acetylglucosaminyl deacetylase